MVKSIKLDTTRARAKQDKPAAKKTVAKKPAAKKPAAKKPASISLEKVIPELESEVKRIAELESDPMLRAILAGRIILTADEIADSIEKGFLEGKVIYDSDGAPDPAQSSIAANELPRFLDFIRRASGETTMNYLEQHNIEGCPASFDLAYYSAVARDVGSVDDWDCWASLKYLTAREAACLMFELEPKHFEEIHSSRNTLLQPGALANRIDEIERLATRDTEGAKLSPAKWIVWAQGKGYAVPDKFIKAATEVERKAQKEVESMKRLSQLTVWIDGREALPVRAIPHVTGWQRFHPNDVVNCLEQKRLTRSSTLTAYHISDNRPVQVKPREWYAVGEKLAGLEAELKLKHGDDGMGDKIGYAAWLRDAVPILPAGVWVWLDDFKKEYQAKVNNWDFIDHERAIDDESPPDTELTLTPMMDADTMAMVLNGFERYTEKAILEAEAKTAEQTKAKAFAEEHARIVPVLPAEHETKVEPPKMKRAALIAKLNEEGFAKVPDKFRRSQPNDNGLHDAAKHKDHNYWYVDKARAWFVQEQGEPNIAKKPDVTIQNKKMEDYWPPAK